MFCAETHHRHPDPLALRLKDAWITRIAWALCQLALLYRASRRAQALQRGVLD